ncbi:MAG TPA: hypothetical protein ENJ28_03505 [Gammaproteobacteria bacterium]|nr:hypothetical protein [Gammaproteobacteria bacterium]
MPRLSKSELICELVPPLDVQLAEQLVDEYISLERRYVLSDFEPATLDGGQFTEAASRIIYHQDSGNLNKRRGVDKCLSYIEDPQSRNAHHFPERKSSLHLCRVLRSIYKFRSDRGAVHIDPEYTANQLDAKLVVDNARWVLSEMLRVFWTGDRSVVARTIREIIEYDVPIVAEYEGRLLVQSTTCTTEEEVMILLYHAGEAGLSRSQLGTYVAKDASGITRAIKSLVSTSKRQVIQLQNGNYRLTDLGIVRVLNDLSEKMGL